MRDPWAFWGVVAVLASPPIALLFTWIGVELTWAVQALVRELDAWERAEREREQAEFDTEARRARSRRYPAARGVEGWWR
jgi:hypothetical protein